MTRWWERSWAVALIALAASIPLWSVRLPPLIDLLGHMGRYHIQLNLTSSALLQRNWDYHWLLIGNLGCDLLMEPLGRVFGVERGTVVLAALLPMLMIWGMVRLARAAQGTLPATTWAAFPFAMAYPWQYGLVNFWLGIALALHAAAWCARRQHDRSHPALLVLGSLALWTAHVFGWAVFAILLAGIRAGQRPLRDWPRVALGLWPLAAPAVLMVVLRYGTAGAAAETLGWGDFGYKALALTWTLRDQSQWLDLGSLIAALLLIYAGFRSRTFEVDRGLALGALGLFSALLILPYQFLGSAYADARLWPVVLIVALLAVRPGALARPGLEGGIALGAALIFAARIAATTVGFQHYDHDFARHLAAFDRIPRGSRVAVFTAFPCDVPWRRPRLEHLDGVAIVRDDLFTNGQWDVPGAELLIPLAARGTPYNSDPSQLVMTCGDLRAALTARIANFPRDRFDYVWVTGYRPETLPRYGGLTPLFADEATILYGIDK